MKHFTFVDRYETGRSLRHSLLRHCCIAAITVLTVSPLANAQTNSSVAKRPVDEANPLVGTAPLDIPELIGNAPPPGEPVYSGITSAGARLPHSATEAAPINVNLELSFPTASLRLTTIQIRA
jgi:hypothetical protein